jgi:membrane-bound lytic murein transglycosylase MltF
MASPRNGNENDSQYRSQRRRPCRWECELFTFDVRHLAHNASRNGSPNIESGRTSKRWPRTAWLLVAVLAAACGRDAPPASTTPAAAKEGPVPAPAEAPLELPDSGVAAFALAPWTGDLDGMIERRLIRVLTTYSKTSYFIDQGTPRGLVADSFKLFEDDLNKNLKNKHLRVQVAIVPVAHDELVPALLQGRGDIVAAGKLVSDWRRAQVDFTNATRSGISVIPVTGPGVPPVASVADLAGREIYLRPSDAPKAAVERFNTELARAGKPPVRVRAAPEVLADEDLIEMVSAGLVPMTLVDDQIAEFWQQIFPGIVLNRAAAVRSDAEAAMMVRKGSPQLLAELNGFLARYPEGSLTRNVLLQKYLKSVKYAKAATSDAELKRFREVVGLMRKYGDQYKLDYLLMAAQGYQESGLDHRRRSQVGAVGVMQVMPKTGAELKVGDVRQLEPNIHAGVKYVRFMIDRYYADEPMDPLNKGLFAFASYNAGPARIRQLREKAAARGLDPNRWFNNVEIVAAESIGRETVQYVSNIYKYYLAYQMAVEQMEERAAAKAAS